MCAHYVGLTDERVRLVISELTGGSVEDLRAADPWEQAELDLPDSGGEEPRVDVFPKAVTPVIAAEFDTAVGVPELAPGTLAPMELSWGFTPQWTSDVVFNTRIESADKPMWRAPMEHGRCLVAARRFYEASGTEMTVSARTGRPIKQQYVFSEPGVDVMLIGAVRRGGEFSLVTTRANADMAPVHPRMPLIVRPGEVDLWFGPDYRALADRSDIRLDAVKAR
ncbi:MAG: SOS response-associated peptidase family protein [Bifidobacterium sp.]|nr:SOS response-associated peptidase family protein [Bifidobacterium sp.]